MELIQMSTDRMTVKVYIIQQARKKGEAKRKENVKEKRSEQQPPEL